MKMEKATIQDAQEILTLQKLAYISEAEIYGDFNIQPLVQNLEEVKEEFSKKVFLKIVSEERIVGSVRAFVEKESCFIEKLIVHPDFQGQGLGSRLIREIESVFAKCKRFELFTGHKSQKNIYLYTKLGYKGFKTQKVTKDLDFVYLEKFE